MAKSNTPWKPRSSRLAVRNKEDGYRYKWASVAHSEDRVEELKEEGWVPVTSVTGGSKIVAGEPAPTSVARIGTLRLMKIPEDMAQGRDDYYQDQTDKQTMRPAKRAANMLEATGGPYAAESIITEEVINPRTGRPFDSREDERMFRAALIRAARYPTAARRSRQP
jgi:hypothetical protein